MKARIYFVLHARYELKSRDILVLNKVLFATRLHNEVKVNANWGDVSYCNYYYYYLRTKLSSLFKIIFLSRIHLNNPHKV